MALGIHKDGSLTVYSVLLVGMGDKDWKDNTWICEHLRHLATKIEQSNFKIFSIGVEMNPNYEQANPSLVIKGVENYTKARTKAGVEILAIDFDKLGSRSKWNLWEKLIDVKWVCNSCHKAYETDGKMDYWDGKKPLDAGMHTVECGWCGNVLTHRTNGGQSNPFEWTFINK